METIRTCVFCKKPLESKTFNWFGIDMHDCEVVVPDRYILARDLDRDVASGLSKLWALLPYDPITMELKDYCLPGTILHDRLYEDQVTSRKFADELWLNTNLKAIATIQSPQLRAKWEKKCKIMYAMIVSLGWPTWYLRKLGFID